jgi:hypothetical protein
MSVDAVRRNARNNSSNTQKRMNTYIKSFGAVASLAASLPLAGQVVDSRACILHRLHRRRGMADELLGLLSGGLLLLSGSGHGFCYSLLHVGCMLYVKVKVLGRRVLAGVSTPLAGEQTRLDSIDVLQRRTRV